VNLTNVCNITNTPGCNTNLLSQEGYSYLVNTTTLVLSEFDNAVGGEVVLWSNPLTNSFDSTNWTLVFGHIGLTDTNGNSGSPTLQTVVSNYNNTATNLGFTGGDTYYAWFGKPVNDPANDFGALGGISVPQSDTMLANGWNTALKVTVNKNPGF